MTSPKIPKTPDPPPPVSSTSSETAKVENENKLATKKKFNFSDTILSPTGQRTTLG